MNAPISAYPPEISGLIRRYKNVEKAERACRIQSGAFNKIRNGKREWDEGTKQRVLFAIEQFDHQPKENRVASPVFQIPAKCPAPLAALLMKGGGKTGARKILKCGQRALEDAMAGTIAMPDDWMEKIQAWAEAGGHSLDAPAPSWPPREPAQAEPAQAASEPAVPAFVPWDGKTKGVVKILAWGKAKGRTIRGVPQPIADLIEKYGKVAQAAQAMGMAGGTLMSWLDDAKPFTQDKQLRVHAAMHGQPLGGMEDANDTPDRFLLNLAIVQVKTMNYDRVNDIAEIMNARRAHRDHLPGGAWLVIYHLHKDDIVKFKKLALRDCVKISCP